MAVNTVRMQVHIKTLIIHKHAVNKVGPNSMTGIQIVDTFRQSLRIPFLRNNRQVSILVTCLFYFLPDFFEGFPYSSFDALMYA